MFQAFHEHAQAAVKAGAEFLDTRSVPTISIDRQIRANLEGEDWQNERTDYEGLEL